MANLIYSYRKKNNLTQTKMAKLLGSTYPQVVSGVENQRIGLTIKQTAKLAELVGEKAVVSAMVKDYKDYLKDTIFSGRV